MTIRSIDGIKVTWARNIWNERQQLASQRTMLVQQLATIDQRLSDLDALSVLIGGVEFGDASKTA